MTRTSLVLVVSLGACTVKTDFADGFRCSDGVCPAGETCVDGFCGTAAGPEDARETPDAPAMPAADAPAAVVDASPPDAMVPPNLATNGGAEAGLEAWNDYQATLSIVTDAPHGGMNAVRVCKNALGMDELFTGTYDVIYGDAIMPGERYVASVWARASTAPGDLPPPGLFVSLRERTSGVVGFEQSDGPDVTPIGTDWVRLEVERTITGADRDILILIVWPTATVPDGTCFDLDDIYVYRAG